MGNTGIYVGLDIGTTSIKVIVAEYNRGQMNVLGVGNERSQGLSRGVIVDIDQTVAAIKKAVAQAEQKANIKIENVIAGIPASQLQIETCSGMIAVGDVSKEITEQDVRNVAEATVVRNLPPEREILSVKTDEFVVDGFDGIKDPRGMIGVRLEMHGTLYTAPKTVIHNMKRCIEKAGLKVQMLVVTPESLGQYALSDGEKDFGTVLIDLGGGISTAAVIHDNKLKYTYTDLEGGEYMTKDISIVLNTTFENAEKLKRDYGNADVADTTEEESFPVNVVGQEVPARVNEQYLSEIIEARLEQILTRLAEQLEAIKAFELPGGVVMTGGVTALPGVATLASAIFGRKVKLFVPEQMGLRHPSFAPCLSYINYGANLSDIDLVVQSALTGQPKVHAAAATTTIDTGTTSKPVVSQTQTGPMKKPKADQSKEKKTTDNKKFEGLKNFFGNLFD